MADRRITELDALTATTVAPSDLAVLVDVSDSTMSASGTNKKITLSDLTAQVTGAAVHNRIINGGMEIAQRGTSFAAIANGAYCLDRWQFGNTSAAAATASQQTDVPSANEFQNSLRFAITTADASIASGDYAIVQQRIEGYNVRDFIGRAFTLSFWVRSSKTGTHCVAFRNSGFDRSYVAEYSVSAANTWEKKSVTVSAGLITTGTWNWATGVGLAVAWTLAAGTTYQTTAGTWQSGDFLATASQVNCLDVNTNVFAITGVQIELGSRASNFEHRAFGDELAMCQRYYLRLAPGSTTRLFGPGQCTSTTAAVASVAFPVPMRDRPSALEQNGTAAHYSVFNSTGGNVACSAVATFNAHTTNLIALVNATVASGLTAGNATSLTASDATAYLGWSAEL